VSPYSLQISDGVAYVAGTIVSQIRSALMHVRVQDQISLAAGGAGGSDTSINLLISNVGVLNANTDAAGITGKKRSVGFMA
jgi:hypothetical protein